MNFFCLGVNLFGLSVENYFLQSFRKKTAFPKKNVKIL